MHGSARSLFKVRDAFHRARGATALVGLLTLVHALDCGVASAGGGPENVLLVVNANSLGSKTIANHYLALRDVPASNVVYLDWRGGLEACQANQFLAKILNPILDAIADRRLANQIDYIVYSSDIPWRMDLKPLFPEEKFSRMFHPIASTTGATYLWQYLRDKNPAIVLPVVNWYVPPDGGNNHDKCERIGDVPSRGFRATYFWNRSGGRSRSQRGGQSYYLSTMLGVTTGRGNTIDEILSYLQRAAEADATRPQGTIYFMKNNDIRSTTRDACYDAVARQLSRQGTPAVVLPGVLPQGANDVLGIMTGTPAFNLSRARVRFLPGAIGDNLTSFGGDLTARATQTPLSEFLRHGAAGASGTVTEPLALQFKFPLATLFLHYTRGCSFAESIYQSVAGPYQLLVVGDPLCQPWAVPPTVQVDSLQPNLEVKGTLSFLPKITTVPLRRVGSVELFVDGRLRGRFAPGAMLHMDTTKLTDGWHELRIVAVDADSIETRGRLIVPLRVNNHGANVEFSASPRTLTPESTVALTARQSGATAIVIRHNGREVARIAGDGGQAMVRAAQFGRGPVVLQAESEGEQPAVSAPLRLEVQ